MAITTATATSPAEMGTLSLARHDVTTQLNYLYENPDGSPPPKIYADPSLGKTIEVNNTQDVTVRDITGEESRFTLDGHGFQFVEHVSQEKDFNDEARIKEVYYPEIEELVKKTTGASRVVIFGHTTRRTPTDSKDNNQATTPIQRVHVDQSYTSGPGVVRRILPDEAEALFRGDPHFQVLNIWRPVRTIVRDPLAIADAHSVPDGDRVGVPLVYPNRVGEIMLVKHGKAHRWHYKRNMTPEQAYIFKCYDSKTDGRARSSPHSAFIDPTVPEDAPPRESIEVRAHWSSTRMRRKLD